MKKLLFILLFSLIGVLTYNEAKAQNWSSIQTSVDKSFIRWSSDWWFDTYVVGSVKITDVQSTGSSYNFWGTFKFTRAGTTYEITCSGKVYSDYSVAELCYKDSSMGMSDCY